MTVSNDSEFKAALEKLSGQKQRIAAARFAGNVLELGRDARINRALEYAGCGDPGPEERAAALQLANAASVDSYTQCGHECDWEGQASHFVAQAALACFKPCSPEENPAWNAAMHARMARTCHAIAAGNGTGNDEAAAQYRMLTELLKN